jgi:hypothetical protein
LINPSDIVNHLAAYLPAVTDVFSETLSGATATASGNTVTVSKSGHGLTAGAKIIVGAGKFRNSLASVVDNGDGSVRFETAQDHDLTEAKAPLDPTTLELGGFSNSAWNGTHTIVAVPNRRTFEVDFPSGETTLPSLTGAYLLESRADFAGMKTIATVPNNNSFTFEVPNVPALPTGTVEGIKIITDIRVWGAADIDRARAMYTKYANDQAVLFVIMTDADVSKDRHTLNDGVGSFTRGNIGKQTILQNFATTVFLPTNSEVSGHTAQNTAYGEVFRALQAVLYGFTFPDEETAQEYVALSNGHGPGTYNSAYYTHVYDWQVPTVAIFENSGWAFSPDVAWRDIESTWSVKPDDAADMTLNVDLDDGPLP